jgi:alpha-galactosidase
VKSIVLIGAGSTYFTKTIVESLVEKGGAWDLRLVDIEPRCLEIAELLAKQIAQRSNAPVTVSGSTDRRVLLPGADAVVSTIGVGGRKAWEKDVFAFRDFDIYQSTGDTYGAGGVSRALRTIPVLIDIARDMERLCPDALLVNFTNPMTVNVWALTRESRIRTVGLCYGVTYYQHFLAKLIGVPFTETWTNAIGVNHFTWITEFRHAGRDAWPLVRKAMKNRAEEVRKMPYAWELFEAFDAFPCVGDGHICEFVPGFQGKGAYYGRTFGVDAAHNFEEYAKSWDRVFEDMADQAYGKKPLEIKVEKNRIKGETFRDEDLFIDVLNALGGGEPVERTVNLPNKGQAANIPFGAVLEGTTLVNSAGFHPYSHGELPPGIAAIMQRILGAQALTVEAALKGERKLAVQAFMADLTAIRKADAERLVDRILETHREYLPRFR